MPYICSLKGTGFQASIRRIKPSKALIPGKQRYKGIIGRKANHVFRITRAVKKLDLLINKGLK